MLDDWRSVLDDTPGVAIPLLNPHSERSGVYEFNPIISLKSNYNLGIRCPLCEIKGNLISQSGWLSHLQFHGFEDVVETVIEL